ncbi:NAD(P)-dependent oxidoreductase [Gordonia sp. ABSL11-1]|uniref:NAD(P)-dependent oxidoreductase n=1 Tax=Gordonia sp. ABSL11-1 TaxID=3053924 RepID=UPI0025736D27|nr:NAD(P)-dependent oxidoreductase [Gordonia sp. ABSL11-1]MDL9948169.1 NAD(P)-dependent oxidoreductase [Gordonia sp. ABSL11-1]
MSARSNANNAAVGWVGLGNIGGPMAQRLVQAGIQVVGTDVDPAALEDFARAGGQAVTSLHEVAAEVETIFLSVPNASIARDVTFGDNGIAKHGRALRHIVDLSTIGAEAARSLAADSDASGLAWIDAPVSGGVAGALQGALSIMTSGRACAIDEVTPFLEHIGTVYRVGDSAGQGQVMKLVNNYLSAAALATTSEALVVGVAAGLAPATMLEIVNVSSGRNSATLDKFPRAVVPRLFNLGFSAGHMTKDVGLFTEQARQLGVPLWVGSSVHEIWDYASRHNGPDSDFSMIVRPYERWAEVEVGDGMSATDAGE